MPYLRCDLTPIICLSDRTRNRFNASGFIVFAVRAAELLRRILPAIGFDLPFGGGLQVDSGFIRETNQVEKNVGQFFFDTGTNGGIGGFIPVVLSARPLE